MRVLIAILCICQTAAGQSIVVSSDGRSIVVSSRGAAIATPQPVPLPETQPETKPAPPIILRPLPQPLPKPVPPIVTKPAPPQKPAPVAVRKMSQAEMIAEHNRLHGGGQWTWPGDLETHLRTTHGVQTVRPTAIQPTPIRVNYPVQRVGNCPGGVCPTNRSYSTQFTRRTKRR